MKHLKGMARGTTVFIVLCLAIYGALVLCKRPAELTVSDEDRAALQQEHGIEILSNETNGGRSALLNTVTGPPIGAKPSKSKLPVAFGGQVAVSDAPAFGDAPAFTPSFLQGEPPTAPSAQMDAPPFGAVSDEAEAPPFTAVVRQRPGPPASVIVQPTPQYGSFHPDIQPKQTEPPVPAPPPVVPDAVEIPLSGGPAGTLWDGPMAKVSDVVPLPAVDPWGVATAPLLPPFVPPPSAEQPVTFTVPTIKPLPKVEEEFSVQVVVAPPIPMNPEPALPPVSTTPAFFEEYHQASIRRLSAEPTPDTAPVVSFAPINTFPNESGIGFAPLIDSPTKNIFLEKATPVVESASVTVPSFVEPKSASPTVVPASLPFVAEKPISSGAETKSIVSLPKLPKEVNSDVRELIVPFVNSQRELIRSNDPNKIRNAYIQLSKLYDRPELNDSERAYLAPVLDHLAVDVIFSRRNHILEPPYIAKVGETTYTLRGGETVTIPYGNSIDSIAAAFNLTPALLMKINGLTNKRPLEPGSELKVVFGQFDGKISTGRSEFTLILGGLYAGRFPITVGEDVQDIHGDFTVTLKDDTLQGRILTLSNGVTLRGVDRPQPGESLRSTVRLGERDAVELYDILGERSVVVLAQ